MRQFDHKQKTLSGALGITNQEYSGLCDELRQMMEDSTCNSQAIEKIVERYDDKVLLVYVGMMLGVCANVTKGKEWHDMRL